MRNAAAARPSPRERSETGRGRVRGGGIGGDGDTIELSAERVLLALCGPIRRSLLFTYPFKLTIRDTRLEMPHSTKHMHFAPLTRKALKNARSDFRRSAVTRFLADENVEPWALHVMRYKRHDIMDADAARIRGLEDRAVFRKAWGLQRVLITHDRDFLDDRIFPLNVCAGLLVLPVYGRVSLEFGNLLSASTAMIGRGREMWFHTKIEATRDFALKVRTWEKAAGYVAEWEFRIRHFTTR